MFNVIRNMPCIGMDDGGGWGGHPMHHGIPARTGVPQGYVPPQLNIAAPEKTHSLKFNEKHHCWEVGNYPIYLDLSTQLLQPKVALEQSFTVTIEGIELTCRSTHDGHLLTEVRVCNGVATTLQVRASSPLIKLLCVRKLVPLG